MTVHSRTQTELFCFIKGSLDSIDLEVNWIEDMYKYLDKPAKTPHLWKVQIQGVKWQEHQLKSFRMKLITRMNYKLKRFFAETKTICLYASPGHLAA